MTLYVRMTDTALSGWGPAKGMTNVMVVECDTAEQAEQIEAAAQDRSEMQRVEICLKHPRPRDGVFYSTKHYDDLGPGWKQY